MNRCEYYQPPNEFIFDDLGKNLLYDNEVVHVAINSMGELEVSVKLKSNQSDDYCYNPKELEYIVKINYCPMCGRKLG